MSSEVRQRKILIIVLNIFIVIGLMSSFTFTTFAWFMTNQRGQVSFASVEVSAPGFEIIDYQVYPVTAISEGSTTNTYTFENTPAVRMPRFDPQNIEYSRYRRALVVHLTFSYTETSNVSFSAKTENATFHTGTSTSDTYDANVTSNVLQITYSSGTTLTSGWTSASLSYFKSDTKSFVNTNPSPQKVSNLPIKTLTNSDSELWFVVEYNSATMDYINSERENEEKEVWYSDDITYYAGL